MTEEYRAHLFLQNSENEAILELMDHLEKIDFETEEEMDKVHNWIAILSRLIWGKNGAHPIVLVQQGDKDADTN